jgi:G2/mitotic-specific cyclin 1/2
VPKKSLQTKKSTTTLGSNGTTQARTRAALGDVSNVTKTNALGATAKDGKKALAPKGAVAKAAQPTKVTKTSSSRTTRPAKKEPSDSLKRPAPGPGVGGAAKKRTLPKPVKEQDPEDAENQEPPQAKPEPEVKSAKPTATKLESVKTAEPEVYYSDDEFDAENAIPDLDKEDADDPLMVSEYVVEIFEYLKRLEIATMANPDYMDNQNELEWKMRGILVDWLLEVHTRFRLLPETLFLAVNIIDRFLSTKVVQLDRLQLVGVTAMFIASKYEEVLSPHVQNFRHVADDGFTEEEILSAERFVLAALNYDLSYPNPMNFLRRISKADNYDIQTRTLGKYLLEISCLDHRFIPYPPSQVAAAAMYLARMVLQRGEWVSRLTLVLLPSY